MCECGCDKSYNIHNNPKSFFNKEKKDKKKKTSMKETELYETNIKKNKITSKKKNKKKNDLKKKSMDKYSNGKNNDKVGGKNKAVKRKLNRINVKDISNKIEKIVKSDKKKRPDFLKKYGGRTSY
jgi:hypothetical protein